MRAHFVRAGAGAQNPRPSENPFLRYVSALDSRVRDEHAAWHGVVLPKDDAFWDTHYPPNGFNCRCYVQAISEREAKALGAAVAQSAPPNIPQGGFKSDIMVLHEKSAQRFIELVNDKLRASKITNGAAYEAIQSELKELRAVQKRIKMFDEVLKRHAEQKSFSRQLYKIGETGLFNKKLPVYISDETIFTHFGEKGKHPEITSFELAILPQFIENIKASEIIGSTPTNIGYFSCLGKWFKVAAKLTRNNEELVTSIYREEPF